MPLERGPAGGSCKNRRSSCEEAVDGRVASNKIDSAGGDTESARVFDTSSGLYKAFLILHNVGKRQNYGILLRSAVAFGINEAFVVGERRLKTFGHQGTANHIHLTTEFGDLEKLRAHLRSRGVQICGIEITDESRNITESPFEGCTAFMLGNEATGMSDKQRSVCDYFVYIPQFSAGTASLNIAVAGGIVFHRFAEWARFREARREGVKFLVNSPRTSLDAYMHPTAEEEARRSALRRQRLARKGAQQGLADYPPILFEIVENRGDDDE